VISNQQLSLKPLHDLRCITGEFHEILKPEPGTNPDDYIIAKYTDERAIPDAMHTLRNVYPNALHITRLTNQDSPAGDVAHRDVRKLGIADLFQEFWNAQTGAEPDLEITELFDTIVQEVRAEERKS
jgi:DNA repair protein SbcD/Mre11